MKSFVPSCRHEEPERFRSFCAALCPGSLPNHHNVAGWPASFWFPFKKTGLRLRILEGWEFVASLPPAPSLPGLFHARARSLPPGGLVNCQTKLITRHLGSSFVYDGLTRSIIHDLSWMGENGCGTGASGEKGNYSATWGLDGAGDVFRLCSANGCACCSVFVIYITIRHVFNMGIYIKRLNTRNILSVW